MAEKDILEKILIFFHMRNLSEEVRDKFTSDLGFVADYLNEGNMERRKRQKIIHVEALCEMMNALTGDSRFTDQVDELLKKQEKGGVLMCEYIDMLEARGQKRGERKGEIRLSKLIQFLLKDRKYEEIAMATSDGKRLQELYSLYGL